MSGVQDLSTPHQRYLSYIICNERYEDVYQVYLSLSQTYHLMNEKHDTTAAFLVILKFLVPSCIFYCRFVSL